MYGIKSNGIKLFIGNLPGRKSTAIYFQTENQIIPVAYIKKQNEAEILILWEKFIENIPEG